MPHKQRDLSGDVKVYSSLPNTEDGPGVTCLTKTGERYCVSWCTSKMMFTLWLERKDGKFIRLRSASSPTELYRDIYPDN